MTAVAMDRPERTPPCTPPQPPAFREEASPARRRPRRAPHRTRHICDPQCGSCYDVCLVQSPVLCKQMKREKKMVHNMDLLADVLAGDCCGPAGGFAGAVPPVG